MDYIYEVVTYCSSLMFASTIKVDSIRYQIRDNLYLRFLSNTKKVKGIVLIFRGGCHYFDDEVPHYVKILYHHLPDVRLVMFEKITPMVDLNEWSYVSDSIKYLRKKFPNEKIYLLGFSMGGIFLYNYLSNGCDEADGYISVSSPLNMDYFTTAVNNNFLYRIIQRRIYRESGVDSMEELVELYGVPAYEHIENTCNLFPNLKLKTNPNTLKKTLAVIGERDLLTQSFLMDRINYPIPTLIVANGYHCCSSSIYYAANFINSSFDKGFNIKESQCMYSNGYTPGKDHQSVEDQFDLKCINRMLVE